MLKMFKVKNFKNFEDELVLDLSKVQDYDFSEQAIQDNLVKTALVYGENGSGKTNLGHALFDIILHLTDKQRNLRNYRLYGNLNNKDATEFTYIFDFSGSELRYHYIKSAPQTLLLEEIFINGTEKLSYNYKTHQAMIKLEGAETLNTDLTEQNLSFVKYVQSNTVLDEKDTDNRIFRQFMQYVDRMLWFSSLEKNEYQGFLNGAERLSDGIINRGKVKDFQNFLHNLGIDYNLEIREIEGEKQLYCRYERGSVNFFSVASRGTCSLTLFYYWLIQLEKASFVFIDEFDAFYHNNLAEAVVKELLKFPHVQAILTTHNTDIMTNDLLRPDCYLKLSDGKIKSFSQLTRKELRKAHNLQKMYRAGAFDEKNNSDHI